MIVLSLFVKADTPLNHTTDNICRFVINPNELSFPTYRRLIFCFMLITTVRFYLLFIWILLQAPRFILLVVFLSNPVYSL